MNTRFLETLIILSQLRSIRATARAMHATPAAISLRIKVLEEELQTALIDRSVKEFRFTPNAEYLLGHAKAVVDATQRLQQRHRGKARCAAGSGWEWSRRWSTAGWRTPCVT